jgi:hypothetical protein
MKDFLFSVLQDYNVKIIMSELWYRAHKIKLLALILLF